MSYLAPPPCSGDGVWRLAAAVLVMVALWAVFAVVAVGAKWAERIEGEADE